MTVDPTQPIPIYFQLKTLLLEEILEGRYGSDGRLPTEHELCERFDISRTPVTRALSELAEEGVILRHRRRGTFVNPHGLRRRPEQPEVRVVVSESVWGRLVADAAPDGTKVNVVTVPLPSLHHALTHAVAEGRAPDLAIVDSVWIAEFAAAASSRATRPASGWARSSTTTASSSSPRRSPTCRPASRIAGRRCDWSARWSTCTRRDGSSSRRSSRT